MKHNHLEIGYTKPELIYAMTSLLKSNPFGTINLNLDNSSSAKLSPWESVIISIGFSVGVGLSEKALLGVIE